MINGIASDFIDKLYYEDHYVLFEGNKYFLNGCQHKKDNIGNTISVRLEVYNLATQKTVFCTEEKSSTQCIEAFENATIWSGKSFWEAEKDMEWVDW